MTFDRKALRIVIAAAVVTLSSLGAYVAAQSAEPKEKVIKITAKKFEYTPNEITLKKGVPVVLEITSLDRDHGFKVPELGVRADVKPGETTRVRIVPDRTGRFEFRCDVFCGSGHEDMAGEIVVVD